MRALGLATVILLALPRATAACATCIASAVGDQTFNWAYLGLILTPFVVGGVFAAVLAICWRRGREESAAAPGDQSLIPEETR